MIQTQVGDAAGAGDERLDDRPGDRGGLRGPVHEPEPVGRVRHRPSGPPGDAPSVHARDQGLGAESRAAAGATGLCTDEAQGVAVAGSRQDLLDHRHDAPVQPLLARPGRDPLPAHPGLQRMLAEGHGDAVRTVQHHPALLVGELPPRHVHREPVGTTHRVQHVHGDLGVDDVAGGRGRDERALAQGAARVGYKQLGIHTVLDTQTLAARTGAQGGIEREQRRRRSSRAGIDALADTREEQPQVIVQSGEGAHGGPGRPDHRPLVQGQRRGNPVDALHRRSLELSEPGPGEGGEGGQVAPLPLPEQGVEGQGGLARARDPGDHGEGPRPDVHVEAAQVVLARADDADRGGRWGTHGRRNLSQALTAPRGA